MKDRIRLLMESQNMTQQTFAQFIEMSPASLSSIFNGRTKPTLNTVEAIRKKIPNISLEWLMFGKEPMYLEEAMENSSENPSQGDFGDLFSQADQETSPSPGVTTSKNLGVIQISSPKEEVKPVEKVMRQITEIRVFFDDQTYESFTAKK